MIRDSTLTLTNPNPTSNLLQVVMDVLDPLVPSGKAAECYEARSDYRDAFLPCFHRRASGTAQCRDVSALA